MKPLEDDIRRMMMPNTASKLKVGPWVVLLQVSGEEGQACNLAQLARFCLPHLTAAFVGGHRTLPAHRLAQAA